jgi:lipopolysaccharide transport system permease protein
LFPDGREVRARYKQSVLGVAWSMLTPLVSSLLSSFLFATVAGISAGNTASGHPIPYQFFAYIGSMFWGFFSSCITSGADSMTSNLQLLTKVYFPREIFTLSSIANRIVDFGFSLITFVFLIFFYAVKSHFMISWMTLLVPLVLVIQLILTLGLSFLLATLNLFYRDVRFVLGQYPVEKVLRHAAQHPLLVYLYLHLNPMTPLILAYQHLVLDKPYPVGADMGGMLVSALLCSLVFLVFGYNVFKKYEGMFAEAV